MSIPYVSVIIATYNRCAYVQETIDSVLAQTYTDYEIIVVDDGSSDGTEEVLSEKYGDGIDYHWQENKGESAARNWGISKARGKYIALLDSDDLWLPDKLAQQVPLLDDQPQTVLLFSHAVAIDAYGRKIAAETATPVQKDLTLEHLCLSNNMAMAPSTALIRRYWLEKAGGFDPSMRHGEDRDLWLRLRLHGPFHYHPQTVAYMRIHQGSQWHARHKGQKDALSERMNNQLKTFEIVFANWPGTVPHGLREKALSNLFLRAGIQAYGSGFPQLGRKLLSKAVDGAQKGWITEQMIIDRLVQHLTDAAFLWPDSGQNILSRLQETFDHWPDSLPYSPDLAAQAAGRLAIAFTRKAYRAQDDRLVRSCWRQVLRAYPRVLADPHLGPFLIRALVGVRPVNWLRRIRNG